MWPRGRGFRSAPGPPPSRAEAPGAAARRVDGVTAWAAGAGCGPSRAGAVSQPGRPAPSAALGSSAEASAVSSWQMHPVTPAPNLPHRLSSPSLASFPHVCTDRSGRRCGDRAPQPHRCLCFSRSATCRGPRPAAATEQRRARRPGRLTPVAGCRAAVRRSRLSQPSERPQRLTPAVVCRAAVRVCGGGCCGWPRCGQAGRCGRAASG